MPAPAPADPPAPAAAAPAELFCPDCGYDLRGIESERCPECGLAIDRTQRAGSRVPWVHRRRIGRARAFGRTVEFMTFHAGRLGGEAALRPVDYAAAQRFRWAVVLFVGLPPAMVLLALSAWYRGSSFLAPIPPPANPGMNPGAGPMSAGYDVLIPWAAGLMLWPVPPLALFLLPLLVSGVSSYWFHPKDAPVVKQNRAVALSYYACAPLAWLPLGLLLLAGAHLTELAKPPGGAKSPTFEIAALLWIFGSLATVGAVALAWLSTLRLYRSVFRPGPLRLAWTAIGITAAWVACVAFALVAVPWVFGFVVLVIQSFGA